MHILSNLSSSFRSKTYWHMHPHRHPFWRIDACDRRNCDALLEICYAVEFIDRKYVCQISVLTVSGCDQPRCILWPIKGTLDFLSESLNCMKLQTMWCVLKCVYVRVQTYNSSKILGFLANPYAILEFFFFLVVMLGNNLFMYRKNSESGQWIKKVDCVWWRLRAMSEKFCFYVTMK